MSTLNPVFHFVGRHLGHSFVFRVLERPVNGRRSHHQNDVI